MTEEFESFIEKFVCMNRRIRCYTAGLRENSLDEDSIPEEQTECEMRAGILAQYFAVGLVVENFLAIVSGRNIIEDDNIRQCIHDHHYIYMHWDDEGEDISFDRRSFKNTLRQSMVNAIVILRDHALDGEGNNVFSDDELNIVSTAMDLFVHSYKGAIGCQMKLFEAASAFHGLCRLESIQDMSHPYDQEQSMLDNEYLLFEKYFEKVDFTKNSYMVTIAESSALKWVKEKHREPQPIVSAQTFPTLSLN